MADLQDWYSTLPDILHLSVLHPEAAPLHAASTVGRDLTFAEHSSMLLGHCLYLSAVMLLNRRIFLYAANNLQWYFNLYCNNGVRTPTPEQMEALGYIRSCLTAANFTGRIMGLLVSEDRLVSKCWLAIYPAFNACLLLLFHVTQRKLWCDDENFEGEFDAVTVGEAIANAKRCLAALEFCASGGDALSGWYLQTLAPFRKTLVEEVVGDPTELSSDMYNILAISAQCAFRPEEASSVGAATGICEDPSASSSALHSGSPLPSSPPSAEVPPNLLYPLVGDAHSLGTHDQGMGPPKRLNLQPPQPGEGSVRGGGVKRVRVEPYPELQEPTEAELVAFFRRVV